MAVKTSHIYAGLLAAAVLTAPSLASAADPTGLYIGGAAGLNEPRDSSMDVPGLGRDADLDTGWFGAVTVGWHWGWGIKTEIEGSFRNNAVDSVGPLNGNGEIRTYGAMLNILYEMDTGWGVRPFIGGGAGYGWAKADQVRPVGGGSIDDRDSGFAWQGIGGLAVDIAPQWTAEVRYQYFSIPDLTYTNNLGTKVDSDYATHEVMVALRYHFGAPPPAPMPVAQPAPPPPPVVAPPPPPAQPARAPRQYIVFFDFDSARLTDQARNIIRQAADAARRDGYARIDLTGHADRSGTDSYNMRLSQRRADAVRAELQRLGLQAGEITTTAKGESQPLVPTADGVREPQNRRVEIMIVDRTSR